MDIVEVGDIMNVIDIAIIFIILAFGVIGAQRGVFKQLVTTVGFLLVVILSFYLKNPVAEFLSLNIPFLGFKASSFNIMFYQAVAFLIVVIILLAVLGALIKATGILEKILKFTIILGLPSKILGFIAGVIEGFVLVFVALFFLQQPSLKIDVVNESKLSDAILDSTPILSNISSSMVDTINDIYELTKDSTDLDSNTLDLKSIDLMLEHKLITKDYVRKLIDAKKINIIGIDSVLNKY